MVIWLRLNPYAIINLDISVLILYINYMSFCCIVLRVCAYRYTICFAILS